MKKFILAVSMVMGVPFLTNAEKVIKVVNSSDIAALKIFTDLHDNPEIRKYTVIKINNKIDGCPNGVFFNYDENKAVYSTVLASLMASKSLLEITAEKSIKSPWGDVTYCAMTSFQIVN